MPSQPPFDPDLFPLGLESLISQRQLEKILAVPSRRIESWRRDGTGPEYCRINGRLVRYRLGTLLDWVQRHSFKSIAEEQS